MPVVSISLTPNLLKRLEEFMENRGYSSRSETIRDAIRGLLSEYDLNRFKGGEVAATITVISDRKNREVSERLMRLRHEHDEIVFGNMHIHLGRNYCLEVFITEGDSKEVMDFLGRIRAMRGIQEVKYTIIPLSTATRGSTYT